MVKYKKWVICIGYSGRGYFGMQRQTCNNKVIEDLPTIENELLKSFLKSGMINENEFNNPNTLRFQRAARTDKGVSAIKQIISMNAQTDVQSLLPKINESLPDHIRVFGAKRATKYFDCKNFCDARTYSYLLPSFSICPLTEITTESYRVPKTIVDEFNEILAKYLGTHNFHNFTSQKKPTDASAKRYIMSFECSEPFMLDNGDKQLEFLVARIKGQSFMLHQIRKMIGLAIAIMRGFADQSTINRSFGLDRIDIPIAPGLGLLLEDVHFERYNKKFGGDGIHEPLVWDEFNENIQAFKNKFIYPDIVDTEIRERSMMNWLDTLSLHTFDVRHHSPLDNQNDQNAGDCAKRKISSMNEGADDDDDGCENNDDDVDKTDQPESGEANLEELNENNDGETMVMQKKIKINNDCND